MTWFFMTPLAIALVVTFVFKNAVDEVAYLVGGIVVVNLVVSLIIAPWQIKALLLVIVLFASRRFLQAHAELPDREQEDEKLILTDRGAEYNMTPPPVEVNKVEQTGKYRGHIWNTSSIKDAIEVTSGSKYRGVSIASKTTFVASIGRETRWK